MNYARLISETAIDRNPPRHARLPDGRTVAGELPADYLASLGYHPLDEAQRPSEDPAAGTHWEARYALDGGDVVQSWVQVENPPPPPRTFSKFRLKLAIASAGFLPQFEQLLASVEVLPGYSGAAAFADAVTLDEDNEKFKDAVKAVKSQFGLTDEQVEEILAASVAGPDKNGGAA